jgi:hypothetical protein
MPEDTANVNGKSLAAAIAVKSWLDVIVGIGSETVTEIFEESTGS